MKALFHCLLVSLIAGSAFAQTAVNAKCPIGKEDVVDSAGTVAVDGQAVGFCCPGCMNAFKKWDGDRQSKFVAQVLAKSDSHIKHEQGEHEDHAQSEVVVGYAEPYALNVCAKTGAPLGSMGDPVVKVIEGRQVKFCCAGCIGGFEKDTAASFAKLDALMIADQKRYYPSDVCIVSGEPIDEAKDLIVGNRLVKVCCSDCAQKIKAAPSKFIADLNEQVIKAQLADYPLDTCVVAGGKLGSMGDPTQMVIAGRLIRFCCHACEGKAQADPAGVLTQIDAAWAANGQFLPKNAMASQ